MYTSPKLIPHTLKIYKPDTDMGLHLGCTCGWMYSYLENETPFIFYSGTPWANITLGELSYGWLEEKLVHAHIKNLGNTFYVQST